jgi:hypothetical protein
LPGPAKTLAGDDVEDEAARGRPKLADEREPVEVRTDVAPGEEACEGPPQPLAPFAPLEPKP